MSLSKDIDFQTRYEFLTKLTTALQLSTNHLYIVIRTACTQNDEDRDISSWPKLVALQDKVNQIMANLFVHNYLVCIEDSTHKEVNIMFYNELIKLMHECNIKT